VRAGERRLRSWCIPDLNAKLAEWAPFHMLMMLEWLRAFKESGAGDEHTAGSYANRAVASQTPEGKMRAWVDENYTQVPLKEKGRRDQVGGALRCVRCSGASGPRQGSWSQHVREVAGLHLPERRAAQELEPHGQWAVSPSIVIRGKMDTFAREKYPSSQKRTTGAPLRVANADKRQSGSFG
jgi:hypothetical protein